MGQGVDRRKVHQTPLVPHPKTARRGRWIPCYGRDLTISFISNRFLKRRLDRESEPMKRNPSGNAFCFVKASQSIR